MVIKAENNDKTPDNNGPNLKVRNSSADRQVNTHHQQLSSTGAAGVSCGVGHRYRRSVFAQRHCRAADVRFPLSPPAPHPTSRKLRAPT